MAFKIFTIIHFAKGTKGVVLFTAEKMLENSEVYES